VPARLIDLRYAASCANCAVDLPVGTKAWWEGDTKRVSCQRCLAGPESEPAADSFNVKAVPMPESGVAGASARAEYERRYGRREQGVLEHHPRLGRLMLAVSEEPQSTKAWAKGADGEQRVGARLERLTTSGAVVLHDRQMPGSRANIDHIVVAPSGVWIVDSKQYKGKVERRDRGRLFRTDIRLYVDGRDRSKLVAGMTKQVAAVKNALDGEDMPIRPVLCFTGSEWPLLAGSFTVDGVLVISPKALVKTISRAADRYVDVSKMYARLSARFPSARTVT
jgi:Nuclease-related domain